jgi:hypothetical protein
MFLRPIPVILIVVIYKPAGRFAGRKCMNCACNLHVPADLSYRLKNIPVGLALALPA